MAAIPCDICKYWAGFGPETEGPDDGECRHRLLIEAGAICPPLAEITERLMVRAAFRDGSCPWSECESIGELLIRSGGGS